MKNWKSILIVLAWLIGGILLTVWIAKRHQKERESWSKEQWEYYYNAQESKSHRGE